MGKVDRLQRIHVPHVPCLGSFTVGSALICMHLTRSGGMPGGKYPLKECMIRTPNCLGVKWRKNKSLSREDIWGDRVSGLVGRAYQKQRVLTRDSPAFPTRALLQLGLGLCPPHDE